jgi:hydrogenase-4 component B
MSPGYLLAGAGMALVVGMVVALKSPRLWMAVTVAGAGAAFAAAVQVLLSGAAWEWQPEFVVCGESVFIRFDSLSAFFVALLSFVSGAGAVYSQEYWNDAEHPRSGGPGRMWWNLLALSLGVTLTVSNGVHFLIAWELFTLSAYFLVTLDRHSPEVRAAGWLYLCASHVAVLCLFAFFALMAARTGSWALGDMRGQTELAPLFWLALAGFGIKAGLFPLHVWLPSAHANAPSHVSAMLSGVTLKIAIYGLVRFSGWLPLPEAAGWVVAALGVASAVLGVAFALGQHDFKRLLAYHSVENIGIILIGLGFAILASGQGHPAWGQLALAGALLHVWNHGLFKSLLFFAAGSVLHQTGTREMSRLGGLWRLMPWTASLFALGAMAISGLPPLNGFVSEWLVYLGLFDATIVRGPAAWAAIPAAILLGMTGALALACFVKVCGVMFLGAPRSEAAQKAHECGQAMRGAMLTLAAGCVAIGLAPAFFWPAISHAVGVWEPGWAGTATPTPLISLTCAHLSLAALAIVSVWALWRKASRSGVKSAVTWDCGYAAPTARMQYTAGSFAGIITEWFAWILRPATHERRPEKTFPVEAEFARHTPETVLEYAVEPLGNVVMRLALAARRFQHGKVQAYLFYLLAAMAALVMVLLLGGGR